MRVSEHLLELRKRLLLALLGIFVASIGGGFSYPHLELDARAIAFRQRTGTATKLPNYRCRI